jgi:hypothetical protein
VVVVLLLLLLLLLLQLLLIVVVVIVVPLRWNRFLGLRWLCLFGGCAPGHDIFDEKRKRRPMYNGSQTAFRPRRRQPHPGASSAGASSAGQRQVQAEQAAVPLKGAQVAVPLKGVQAAMPLKGVQATLSFLSPKGVQAAVPQERGEATATTMPTTTFEVL